jgi:hypothetical protein
MLVLAAAVRWSDRKLKEGIWHDMALTAIGAATFMAIAVGIEQPISYSRDCTGPFVRKVESVQKSGPRDIVFYKISADGDAVKFMVNIDKPLKPQFVKTPEALLGFKTSAYFIAVKENFDALPQDRVRVLDSGKISGNNCVVFTLVQ